MSPSRSSGGDCGAAYYAIFQIDLDLYGRISAGIQNLTAKYIHNFNDLLHQEFSFHFGTQQSDQNSRCACRRAGAISRARVHIS